jgi:hypothetical protein
MFVRTARVAPEKRTHRPPAVAFICGGQGEDMAKLSYAEQLLHPNWQRKRLEVLGAADFKCAACGCGDKTLHVHHKRYVKGRMAWEYEADELRALCKDCHAKGHNNRESLDRLMACTFARDVLVEDFIYPFLCGFLSPMGIGDVTEEDVRSAFENEPSFFGLGFMLASLGPADVARAVKQKNESGRFGKADTGPLMLFVENELGEAE